jgi:hypothetical protein
MSRSHRGGSFFVNTTCISLSWISFLQMQCLTAAKRFDRMRCDERDDPEIVGQRTGLNYMRGNKPDESFGAGVNAVTLMLTNVSISVTETTNLARERTGRGGTPRSGARGRCPRAELQTAPGQLRASVSWHYRPGREVLAGRGQVKAGNTRKNCVRSCRRKADVTGRR